MVSEALRWKEKFDKAAIYTYFGESPIEFNGVNFGLDMDRDAPQNS